MQRLPPAEYLGLGRQLASLLGSCLEGAPGDELRELDRAYDPSANEARISAEVFLFHKYLLMLTCVGVFPESEVDHVVGGLFAALNERVSGLEFSPERQQRAVQFDQPFSQDQVDFLDEGSRHIRWKKTIVRFCQNVREIDNPPTYGPGPMAHPKQQAALSPQSSITWCRHSAK